MSKALKFVLIATGAALTIGVSGGAIAGPEARTAVWLGAGMALVVQFVLFYAFFIVAFAEKPLLAHGLGMLGRLVAVGTTALFWAPWAGVPAAPLLFSLVAVLFVTTLAEPLFVIGEATES